MVHSELVVGLSWARSVLISDAVRWKKLGVPVVIGGDNLPSPGWNRVNWSAKNWRESQWPPWSPFFGITDLNYSELSNKLAANLIRFEKIFTSLYMIYQFRTSAFISFWETFHQTLFLCNTSHLLLHTLIKTFTFIWFWTFFTYT